MNLEFFTGIYDLISVLVTERDRQKAAAIEVELTKKIIEVQTQTVQQFGTITEQQGRIAVLEERCRELEAKKAEKERYLLAKLGTVGQFYAYALRDASELEERVNETPHFICQPCFELDKKAVLVGNGEGYWHCPLCKHGAQTEPVVNIRMSAGRRTDFTDF